MPIQEGIMVVANHLRLLHSRLKMELLFNRSSQCALHRRSRGIGTGELDLHTCAGAVTLLAGAFILDNPRRIPNIASISLRIWRIPPKP